MEKGAINVYLMRELKLQLDHANTAMKKKLYRHYLKRELAQQGQKKPYTPAEEQDIQNFKDIMRGATQLSTLKKEQLVKVKRTVDLLNDQYQRTMLETPTEAPIKAIQNPSRNCNMHQTVQTAPLSIEYQPSFFQKRPSQTASHYQRDGQKMLRPLTAFPAKTCLRIISEPTPEVHDKFSPRGIRGHTPS